MAHRAKNMMVFAERKKLEEQARKAGLLAAFALLKSDRDGGFWFVSLDYIPSFHLRLAPPSLTEEVSANGFASNLYPLAYQNGVARLMDVLLEEILESPKGRLRLTRKVMRELQFRLGLTEEEVTAALGKSDS